MTTDDGVVVATTAPGLDDAAVRAEAELLDRAERDRLAVRATTSVYPDATIDDAYRVQAQWRALRLDRGERIVGHKIGLTSREMQLAMGIDTPDSGFLTDSMVFDPDATIEVSNFLDLRVEVELAFVLDRDMTGDDLSVDGVLAATRYVQPAIELIAARSHRVDPVSGRKRTVVDTIADNAACAGVVSGGVRIVPRTSDLPWVGSIVTKNGEVEATGLAAGVLGHPALGVAWLARRYLGLGQTLRAGDIVLAGSFTRPIPVASGDDFDFDFGSFGRFGLRFA